MAYDASAKADGRPSLNNFLITGPKFNQKIFDILVRSQSYPVGLIVDIEGFLNDCSKGRGQGHFALPVVKDLSEGELTIRTFRFT